MTDVYVALKQLRRRGGGRRPGHPEGGLTGPALDTALDRMALRFPDRVN